MWSMLFSGSVHQHHRGHAQHFRFRPGSGGVRRAGHPARLHARAAGHHVACEHKTSACASEKLDVRNFLTRAI
jgi:hypothetical protein